MSSIWEGIHERLLVKSVDQNGDVRPVGVLDNDSIRPTPARDRKWTRLTYMFFWFSATANVSNLYASSTGVSMGLTMWEAIACSFAGQFLAGCLMALNGRAGAVYRIPFPVLCRSSFGPWGAFWPTFNRAAMSIVWNGVNVTQGAQCLYVFLHAIFPSIARIPDKMGPKSALTSAQMICFLVYWLVNCAFLVVPVPKMKKLIYIKVVVYYGGAFAMLAWVVRLAGGNPPALHESSEIHGRAKSWLICKFLFLGLASCGTFISNAADLQRPTAKEEQLIWNPLTFLDKLMEGERYTPGNRAACAFISLAYVYSTVFSAIFENSIPAGNDIAALLPRYITVKRGFFICAILSYAICPWYLLATASVFITFLSSYQIFLSAIAGVLICDYYLVRRGWLDIPSLYTARSDGVYHFFHGFNLRGFGAYIVAVAPNFYGFLNQMGVKAPLGIQRFYFVAYPVGLLIAFGMYYLGCLVWPPAETERTRKWKEPKEYWDEFDPDRVDGVEAVTVLPVVIKGEHGDKTALDISSEV
ncbi:hypothetical protein AbraIFM66951_001043 [Aspergillus brasiliensis]|uniref:NCS1 nucleoside transporter n=1 Tax=Aspergillus brasiliensis TaxID=319629 RepID=A0A9W6DQ58_9EURO|nr:hypothetical protein AbraCBS73388_001140 [Aspergillus brasiliensis]GKZ48804.1 hypothetical protein AbraIFM66951_001043 [Aspergillus brasiliensis]